MDGIEKKDEGCIPIEEERRKKDLGEEEKDEGCNPGEEERKEKDLLQEKKGEEYCPGEEEREEKDDEEVSPDGDEQAATGAGRNNPLMEAFEEMQQDLKDNKLQDLMTIDDFVDKFIDYTLERVRDGDALHGQDLDELATALVNEILDSLARDTDRGLREACTGRERFEEGVNNLVDSILRKITESITVGGQLIPPLGENGKPEHREFKITVPKLMFSETGDHRDEMDAGFDVVLKWEKAPYPEEPHPVREAAADVDVRGDIFCGARIEKFCIFELPQDKDKYRLYASFRLGHAPIDDVKRFIGPQLPNSFDDMRKIQPFIGPLLPPEGYVRLEKAGGESKPKEHRFCRMLCCGLNKQRIYRYKKSIRHVAKTDVVVSPDKVPETEESGTAKSNSDSEIVQPSKSCIRKFFSSIRRRCGCVSVSRRSRD